MSLILLTPRAIDQTKVGGAKPSALLTNAEVKNDSGNGEEKKVNWRDLETQMRQALMDCLGVEPRPARADAVSMMSSYQRRVCKLAMEHRPAWWLDSASAQSAAARKAFSDVDWSLEVQPRRFGARFHEVADVSLEVATPDTFSILAALMRHDTWEIQQKLRGGGGIDRGDFSTFFFCIRSMFVCMVEKELYIIRARLRPKKDLDQPPQLGQEAVVGFAQVSHMTSDARRRRKHGGLRKRKVDSCAFWVDYFEVFADFRRLGIGRRAAALFPSVIQRGLCQLKHTSICLNPLETAERFWKNCGYRWSAKNDGHFRRPLKPPSTLKRPRLE